MKNGTTKPAMNTISQKMVMTGRATKRDVLNMIRDGLVAVLLCPRETEAPEALSRLQDLGSREYHVTT